MSIAKWGRQLARLLVFLPLLQVTIYLLLLRDRFPFESGSIGRQLAILLYAYIPMSVGTGLVLAIDKWLAVRNANQSEQAQRIPEGQLHLLEWLGGWPGSWLAQRWLRHKTSKSVYQWQFWPIVVAHLSLLAWLGAAGGLGLLFSLSCWLCFGCCLVLFVGIGKIQQRRRGLAQAEASRSSRSQH